MLWRKTLTYWKSITVTCVITYGCLLRKPIYSLPNIEHGDKWVHWIAFMLLTLVLLWDSKKIDLKQWKIWSIAILFPALYGGLIEILQQLFFYPRTGEWTDWLADCVGIAMGVIIGLVIQKWYERRMAQ